MGLDNLAEGGTGGLFAGGLAELTSLSIIPQTGLVYWYAANQDSASAGDNVASIPDQSGNGNDASRIDDGTGTYESGGAMGSNPYYDLVDDRFESPAAHSTSLTGYSLYLVYRNKSHPPADSEDRCFEFSESGGLWPYNQDTSWYLGIGDSGNRWIDSVAANGTSNANAIIAYGSGSQNEVLHHNDTTVASLGTQSTSTYTFSSNFYFGGSSSNLESNQEFYEFIFYNRYLDSSERTEVESYLSDKYGITT